MTMKNYQFKNLIKFFSITFVLSYFFMHNISIVFMGIILSLYDLNKDFIDKIFNYKYKNSRNTNKSPGRQDKKILSDTKDSKISLAETIEELGFIPSLDSNNDSKII